MNTELKGIPLLRKAKIDDIVVCSNGVEYEFVRLKRAYFIGRRNGTMYNVPVESALHIRPVEGKVKFDPSSLSDGDLFYILNNKKEPVIFRFKYMININRISAENPVTGQGYTVGADACVGNVREFMRR